MSEIDEAVDALDWWLTRPRGNAGMDERTITIGEADKSRRINAVAEVGGRTLEVGSGETMAEALVWLARRLSGKQSLP